MELTFVVPGRLETRTGGYGYDRRIIEGLRARGWSVDVHELDDGFPRPTPAALENAAAVLEGVPGGRLTIVDGLAFGAMPGQAEREAARLRLVALVHHPLAAESGLDRATARALETSERRALAAARLVVVTSGATAAMLESYGVGADRVHVVEPGTDAARCARGSGGPSVHLLCVASLIPRKGHDTLFRALASVRSRNWRLTCVGSLGHDPATVERLRAVLRAADLEDRVALVGDMDRASLDVCYDAADAFVLPTLYEGYGMAVAEALARGLPVISTATGGIGGLLGAGPERAGLLVAPADVPELAAALSAIIEDSDLRARLARGARQVGVRLPTWAQVSSEFAEALTRVQR